MAAISINSLKRYKLHEEIGSGGMGSVYRGTDTQTGESVAVKKLKPSVADAQTIERFRREAQSLSQLNHPNIVKLLEMIEADNEYYLIMELVTGGSLQERLNEVPQLAVQEVLDIALDLCDALTRTHRLGIIHRDLKPANVLIAEDNTPRLTDFGIAHIPDSDITGLGMVLGTYAYLSPEVLNSEAISPQVDIWAFGVMLFEMLTGETPFRGDTTSALITAILTQPPPDLELLRAETPIALIDLIYRMLAKNPSNRIPSIRVVGMELEAIMQQRVRSSSTALFIEDKPTLIATSRFSSPTPTYHVYHHNLPVQTTPFIGRNTELATINKLLADSHIRFITILGMGGMGKSRLALQAAEAALETFSNGAYFVGLSALSSTENMVAILAEAIGFQFLADNREPRQQVLDYLSRKQMLLIMDNFEHLLSGAKLVSAVLQAAPEVKIIVTSRERLNIEGETVFNLDGMQVPDWQDSNAVLQHGAAQLFLQAAQRVQPSFALQSQDLQQVARIAQLVEGSPLGILLAAPWIEMLSLSEIVDEISHSLDFLVSQQRDAPQRQRSLRAVFEYSWAMLTQAEQEVFMKLSIFRGGMTRAAAQDVTDASLHDLVVLFNKSLIQRDTVTGRYTIHELLRQYAEEQLESSGNVDDARAAHMNYYADVMQEYDQPIRGRRQAEVLNKIEIDFSNVHAAWAYAIEIQDVTAIERLGSAATLFVSMRNRYAEVATYCAESLQILQALPRQEYIVPLGKVLFWHGFILNNQSRFAEAEAILRQALEIKRETDDKPEIASTLFILSDSVGQSDRLDEAFEILQECLILSREIGHKWIAAHAMRRMSYYFTRLGQLERAYEFDLECLEIYRELGDKYNIANVLSNIGSYSSAKGKYEESENNHSEALALRREIGQTMGIVWSLSALFNLALGKGDFVEARRLLNEILLLEKDLSTPAIRATMRIAQSEIAILDEQYSHAYELGQEALSLAEKGRTFSTITKSRAILGLASCYVGNFEQAIELLIPVLEDSLRIHSTPVLLRISSGIAFLLAEGNEYRRAAELIGLLDVHSAGFPEMNKQYPPILDLVIKLKAELGDDAYQAAYEHGSQLDLDAVIKSLLTEFGKVAEA